MGSGCQRTGNRCEAQPQSNWMPCAFCGARRFLHVSSWILSKNLARASLCRKADKRECGEGEGRTEGHTPGQTARIPLGCAHPQDCPFPQEGTPPLLPTLPPRPARPLSSITTVPPPEPLSSAACSPVYATLFCVSFPPGRPPPGKVTLHCCFPEFLPPVSYSAQTNAQSAVSAVFSVQ